MTRLVSREKLEKVLSPKQLDVLELACSAPWAFYDGSKLVEFRRPDDLVDESTLEEIESVCSHLMDLKIIEYRELVGASQEQVQKLERAKTHVIAEVMGPFESLVEKVSRFAGPEQMIAGKDWLVDMIQEGSLQSRCFGSDLWKSTIREVFDAEQLTKIEERELNRRLAWSNQCVKSLVAKLVRRSQAPDLRVGDTRYLKLVEMIKSEVDLMKIARNDIYDTSKQGGCCETSGLDLPNRFHANPDRRAMERFSQSTRYYRHRPHEFFR